jgi:hypothetical protein
MKTLKRRNEKGQLVTEFKSADPDRIIARPYYKNNVPTAALQAEFPRESLDGVVNTESGRKDLMVHGVLGTIDRRRLYSPVRFGIDDIQRDVRELGLEGYMHAALTPPVVSEACKTGTHADCRGCRCACHRQEGVE